MLYIQFTFNVNVFLICVVVSTLEIEAEMMEQLWFKIILPFLALKTCLIYLYILKSQAFIMPHVVLILILSCVLEGQDHLLQTGNKVL